MEVQTLDLANQRFFNFGYALVQDGVLAVLCVPGVGDL
jgi:hypothetical protein